VVDLNQAQEHWIGLNLILLDQSMHQRIQRHLTDVHNIYSDNAKQYLDLWCLYAPGVSTKNKLLSICRGSSSACEAIALCRYGSIWPPWDIEWGLFTPLTSSQELGPASSHHRTGTLGLKRGLWFDVVHASCALKHLETLLQTWCLPSFVKPRSVA
jgi:hypothetical protein